MATEYKQFELSSTGDLSDPSRDALYAYSLPKQKEINEARPWKGSPKYFQHVRISSVALLKMVTHARSGGNIEVMGLMIGYTSGNTFIVTDAFRLPVEGTETRVNAGDAANEYMVNFLEGYRSAGQAENAVGWYHSHPGYGCWLSGIDVGTQRLYQFSEPWVAVVIDPDRTVSSGKVDIGAFRTYPEGHKPAQPSKESEKSDKSDGSTASNHQSWSQAPANVPKGKAEDFGAHADQYYPLEVSHYKSSLDSKLLAGLWNKYWVGTLSSNPLLTNREYGTKQIEDLGIKVADAEQHVFKTSGAGLQAALRDPPDLDKLVKASNKIAAEEKAGLTAEKIKEDIFGVDHREP
ncbi:COP9 signalosome complex subunit 5 [Eremomyces bilateralis CBS 781.70]|uniref:COP9 signalosome complex subunit 5 n=1 Tax=Eremomyces bilateralis CBS 781.70 TaxID=1392243 RepID=A0A6G1GAR8_9PEZI|nr:COP9 signalosome complex subunit 5 [Eremomyces bilateralis CBS 781.70]KAF1814939.1 COP9 signalosome complex subunit 5 [Eremomyces bilateralis CBS 781.70]